LVESGMVVGLGSGTTSECMIRSLGEEVDKGLSILAVASSKKSAKLAESLGIALTSLEEAGMLDINIDGADEFDPELRLIKGGGGALLREKILAHYSKYNVIIADSRKQVAKLGNFKLPLEIIPFAAKNIVDQLAEMGMKPELRKEKGQAYKTDEQNYIVDVDILGMNKLDHLNNLLLNIPGIVETGLFINYTDLLIMGKGDATITFTKTEKGE